MKIVIIRPGGLGDNLLTFPMIVALKEKYDHPHITFVGHPAAVPLAKAWGYADEVFDHNAQWEEIYAEDGISSPQLLELFQQTDLVVYWNWFTAPLLERNLLKIGVKQVIYAPYNRMPQLHEPPHVVLPHMAEYVAGISGLKIAKPERVVLPYTGPSEPLADTAPIAIHPGANLQHRCWPSKSHAKLIHCLLQRGYPVLLVAGPDDVEALKTIRQSLSAKLPQGMLTVLENQPLLEVSKKLKQAGCYIGHDTGVSHLAGLLGIPTLTLFGYSDPEVWRPLGPYVEVLQKKPLKRLRVKKVLEHTLRMYTMHLQGKGIKRSR